MDRIPLIIDGSETPGTSGEEVEVLDPSTGQPIAVAVMGGLAEAAAAAEAAQASFRSGAWSDLRPFERGRIMQRVGDLLLEHRDELARIEALESGKPLRDAYWEVDCSARFFEFYGGFCDKLQGTTVPLGPGWMDWTVHEPVGVSLHIVPWNYPLQVCVRGIAPALAAGCTVIVKPAEQTPISAYRLAQLCQAAGMPAGTVSVVNGSGSVVGDALARHPAVDQITFTGSVETGKRVLEAAASHTVPTTMELGGKSPQLVFDDADLDRVLPVLHQGMWLHAGQVCNAGTRLVVHERVADETVARLHERIKGLRLGRALDDPDMGPVISREQQQRAERYMEIGAEEGTLLLGADRPSDPDLAAGWYVRPSIVTGVGNEARVAREEIFGPVLAVIAVEDDDAAIEAANDSDFGLVAGVFTSSVDRAMRASERLRAGQVWVNAFGVGLDVEFPFGGYKRSGFGREKGLEAVKAYTQVKNTCVAF